ncbi:M16 family metallopeptidase [Blastochloris viridis]|uniref:Mitochondrial processing peptidase-like protein n=1 Tax=Blastochloris viridis TaxID=1079 RepID=A0A0H5BAK0_BLAVI|nr:pitrilysin family protein [Blastochloris viridis]ALK10822.1 Protease 3 precursor [Blastochloris viridis]BAR99205.1 mitochondrial processing peptidase-like protein [Blastochloris viridis]CUU43484.1 Protease 3 precursor [Blastochloris viridis]
MTLRLTRLDNGLTVATHAMPELKTAALGVWVDAGARDEREGEHGLSHLLEHMAFKGTRRRTARAIAEEIEAVGGDLNAATSVETTAYFAHVLAEDAGLGLDILADILTESVFEADELTREKSVILQEIGAANDTPDDIVFDHVQAVAFADQPIGRSILGTPGSVRALGRDQLQAYLDRHYLTGQTVLAAVGAVDHDQIVAAAHSCLSGFGQGLPPEPPAALWQGGVRLDPRDLDQTHLILGFEGVSYHDPAYFALQAFTIVAGGGMSSRLFQEVREKRGLAYSIYSFHWPYADTGLFGVYVGTDQGDTGEVTRVIADELAGAGAGITLAEVARAKAQMKAGLLMAMERPTTRAEQIARQILIYGRPLDPDEIVAKIDALTVEDVRNAGLALTTRAKPAFAGVGPAGGLETAASMAESLWRSAA